MNRLTPERKKQIRDQVRENVYFSCPSSYEAAFANNAIHELLKEIDELTKDAEIWEEKAIEWMRDYDKLKNKHEPTFVQVGL